MDDQTVNALLPVAKLLHDKRLASASASASASDTQQKGVMNADVADACARDCLIKARGIILFNMHNRNEMHVAASLAQIADSMMSYAWHTRKLESERILRARKKST